MQRNEIFNPDPAPSPEFRDHTAEHGARAPGVRQCAMGSGPARTDMIGQGDEPVIPQGPLSFGERAGIQETGRLGGDPGADRCCSGPRRGRKVRKYSSVSGTSSRTEGALDAYCA